MTSPTLPCPFCDPPADDMFTVLGCAWAKYDPHPVAPGHMLIIPGVHTPSLFTLDSFEMADVWSLVAEMRCYLSRELAAHAFTVGINDGADAGQTVMHAHVHLIPRHPGDLDGWYEGGFKRFDHRGGVRNLFPPVREWWERVNVLKPVDRFIEMHEAWWSEDPAAPAVRPPRELGESDPGGGSSVRLIDLSDNP